MRCVICNSPNIRKKQVEEEIRIGNDITFVTIETLVCDECGERYYDRRTMKKLEDIEQAVKEKKANIVGISALLTTTMTGMKDVIQALKESNLREEVKVMIGGAPVTQSYADEIEADGYAPDAASAVDKAKILLGVSKNSK